MKLFIRGIAVVGLIAILSGTGLLVQFYWHPDEAEAQSETDERAARRTPVLVTDAKEMVFEKKVVVSGNVQAKNFALVSARMPGPLDAVFVDEGADVQAGQTQLFQTDSLKLKKAVAMAEQGLSVAEYAVHEKEASLEQVVASQEQADVDWRRYQELGQHNAVPLQLVEQQESSYKQASAMVKHAEALLALEKNKFEQARLTLTMAEKDLDDSLVLAPITGRVSERFKEPGEMAGPGTPILKIEDLSTLEISVHLPEEFYAEVVPGQTRMRIAVGGIELGSHPVTYKSPTVHSKLRTFEAQGVVQNAPAGVVPGCLAAVSIVLDSRTGIGIPTAAIQLRGEQPVAFTVDAEVARMVPLEVGREADGWTEVPADQLSAGTPVITMGQTLVEHETPVVLVKEGS